MDDNCTYKRVIKITLFDKCKHVVIIATWIFATMEDVLEKMASFQIDGDEYEELVKIYTSLITSRYDKDIDTVLYQKTRQYLKDVCFDTSNPMYDDHPPDQKELVHKAHNYLHLFLLEYHKGNYGQSRKHFMQFANFIFTMIRVQ